MNKKGAAVYIKEYWKNYICGADGSLNLVDCLANKKKKDLHLSEIFADLGVEKLNGVTYAAAFAQIKITGHVDAKPKTMAQNTMRRTEITADASGWNTGCKSSEVTARMMADLDAFPAG
jgi:uncharacterized protein YfeS